MVYFSQEINHVIYSATTPTKATRQKVPQIYQIKIAEVNNSFPAN